jgi:Formyltetrahydrofolate synthetase
MKKIKPIEQISEELGISPNDLELYGKFKAKIPGENIKKNNNDSKLVVELQ